MAEALFRRLCEGAPGIRIESAGLSAANGQPASRDAVEALAAEGVEFRSFRSQPVSEELLERATHVFVMTRDHHRLIDLFFPEFMHKVRLLRFEPRPPNVVCERVRVCEYVRTRARARARARVHRARASGSVPWLSRAQSNQAARITSATRSSPALLAASLSS